MSGKLDAQVVVVGAGPTGLMLACELKLMGVDVAIIEKRATGTGESRAPGINARSMEVFGQRGLAQRFQEKGRPLSVVLFSGLPMLPGKAEPGWPDALILPQHQTERILTERATELGVPIRWSTELLHLVQDAQGVDLVVAESGTLKTLRASYVAGCDGGHSAVRRTCGARFDGDDPVSHWVVADVQLDAPPGEKESFGRNTRVGTYQVSRVEPEWFRLSLMKVTPPADRAAPVTIEELRQAMFEGLGTDYGLSKVRWMSRFADGFRQVDHYRYGRVFLAGDAGHIHSPVGGQGLNLGIQDAVNLGWKLGAVINRGAPDALLDTYDEERHAVADDVVQLSKAQTALIKPGVQIDALRKVVAKMLAVPEVTHDVAGILSGLALRYPWGEGHHPLVGRRMPNLVLTGKQGRHDVFSLMHAGRPLLLNFGAPASVVAPERWSSWIDTVDAQPHLDGEGATWRLPVVGPFPAPEAIFVRPDGYVAWVKPVGAPASPCALPEAVARWLG